jgi:hypothetical protein
VPRVFFEIFQTDRLQVTVDLGVEQARRGRLALDDLQERVQRGLGQERRPAGE